MTRGSTLAAREYLKHGIPSSFSSFCKLSSTASFLSIFLQADFHSAVPLVIHQGALATALVSIWASLTSVLILVSRVPTNRRLRHIPDRKPTIPIRYRNTDSNDLRLNNSKYPSSPPTSTTRLTPPLQATTPAYRPHFRLGGAFKSSNISIFIYLPWSLTTVEWLGGAFKSSIILYMPLKPRCAPIANKGTTPREACKPLSGLEAPRSPPRSPACWRTERKTMETREAVQPGFLIVLVGGWTGKRDLFWYGFSGSGPGPGPGWRKHSM